MGNAAGSSVSWGDTDNNPGHFLHYIEASEMIIASILALAAIVLIVLALARMSKYEVYPVFMGKVPNKEKEALKKANKR